jgi:hypothetical protein
MRALVFATSVLLSAPAAAEVVVHYPVTIPQECFELAQREGVPTVIENKYQAARARLKLANMRNSDHLVRECRAAVARVTRAAKEAGELRQ